MVLFIPDQKSIPASERIKTTIIDKLDYCFDLYYDLMYWKDMKVYNQPAEKRFRSAVKTLFDYIAPKIKDHIEVLRQQKKDDTTERADMWDELITFMARYGKRSYMISLSEMIDIMILINQFCDEYKITSTMIRTGNAEEIQL